jgi:hypothetical protein
LNLLFRHGRVILDVTIAMLGSCETKRKEEQWRDVLSKKKIGLALINFCANGETLILKQNVDLVKAVLEGGQFVLIVTNMTQTKSIDELLSLPREYVERIFFKCSFHWLELKRLGLVDRFVENVHKIWDAGASFTIEITPSDELESYIDEIKEFSMKHFGALPHITIPRDDNNDQALLSRHSIDGFYNIWRTFNSPLLDYKLSIWGISMKGKTCYVGDGAYAINATNGNIYRCSSRGYIGNVFKEKGLPRNPVFKECPFAHCYNGHSWLSYGLAPGMPIVSHELLRDRVTADGRHWVGPKWRKIFHRISRPRRYSKLKLFFIKRQLRKKRHSFWWHLVHFKF